jgi:hypothetical protein
MTHVTSLAIHAHACCTLYMVLVVKMKEVYIYCLKQSSFENVEVTYVTCSAQVYQQI